MKEQSQTAPELQCSVCGDSCSEQHHGSLRGFWQSEAGRTEHYLLNLCCGCFFGALSYLRQEREIMHLFCDEPPASDETFGLFIDPGLEL